jgi:hypothetical protein
MVGPRYLRGRVATEKGPISGHYRPTDCNRFPLKIRAAGSSRAVVNVTVLLTAQRSQDMAAFPRPCHAASGEGASQDISTASDLNGHLVFKRVHMDKGVGLAA